MRLRSLLILCLCLSKAHADDAVFRVGVTLPLTGAFAEYGVAIKNGIELAREDLDSVRHVSFMYEDDAYEPKRGVLAYEKLRTMDKANVIFAWGIEPVRAIAPVAEKAGFPTIVGSLDGAASEGRKFVIGAFSPYAAYSCELMEQMAQRGLYRLGYMRSEVSLFNGLIEAARECLMPGQTLTEIESFLPADQDFRSAITKAARKSFDAVGVYLTSPQLMTFFKQAAELKFENTYFGPTLFYDRALLRHAHELLTGAFLTHNIASETFSKRYVDRFGNDTHIGYAAHAYEIAALLLRRFPPGRHWSKDEVLSELSKPISPTGSVAGIYTLSAHARGGHYFSFPAGVYRITKEQRYERINTDAP